MTVTAYAPGLTVEVKDNPPVPPATVGGSGHMTVYAKGLTVAVIDVVPSADVPEIVTVPVDFNKVTCDIVQYDGGRYDRYLRPLILKVAAINQKFKVTDLLAGGGVYVPLDFTRYGWKLNGVERAAFSYAPTSHNTGAPHAVGATQVKLAAGTVLAGDVVRFANHPDTYAVTKGAVAPALFTISARSLAPPVNTGLRVAVPAGTAFQALKREGTLVGALGDAPDGLTRFDLIGYSASGAETLVMTHWGHIDRNGGAKDDPNTVCQTSSHHWAHMGAPYQFAVVPEALLYTTRAKPLPLRVPVNFTNECKPSDLTLINYIAPGDGTPTSRPAVNAAGITLTSAIQDYFWADMISSDPRPRLPHLDGPFGIATLSMVCDLEYTRALDPATGKPFVMKIMASTPYAASIIAYDGTKRTVNGIRHKAPPLWTEEQQSGAGGYVDRWDHIEYVGHWDASVPQRERFPLESWGSWTDPRTTVLDHGHPPVDETGFPPHPLPGPVKFRSDVHGFVLREQYDGHDHVSVATVQRWKPALDPWGMSGLGNVLFVCERGADAITMHNVDTAAPMGNFAEGPHHLGSVQNRIWIYGLGPDSVTDPGRFKETRKYPCVGPEGFRIAWIGGIPYGYWGSRAQCDIRRKRILLDASGNPLQGSQQTAPVEIVAHPKVTNNTNYGYIAVSEDNRSFGPVGTVLWASWSAINEGRPLAYVPSPGISQYDGVTPVLNSRSWDYISLGIGVPCGPGGKWRSASYTTACDVGPGMLVMGSADQGLDVLVMYDAAVDGPKPTTAQYAAIDRGHAYYMRHFQVLHGPYCNGPDIPLPWGENADCDLFMRRCGYAP